MYKFTFNRTGQFTLLSKSHLFLSVVSRLHSCISIVLYIIIIMQGYHLQALLNQLKRVTWKFSVLKIEGCPFAANLQLSDYVLQLAATSFSLLQKNVTLSCSCIAIILFCHAAISYFVLKLMCKIGRLIINIWKKWKICE